MNALKNILFSKKSQLMFKILQKKNYTEQRLRNYLQKKFKKAGIFDNINEVIYLISPIILLLKNLPKMSLNFLTK